MQISILKQFAVKDNMRNPFAALNKRHRNIACAGKDTSCQIICIMRHMIRLINKALLRDPT